MHQTIKNVSEKIRNIRQSQELTLERLSNLTGISISMLSMIERGEANPSIGSLIAISKALNISMSELFEFENHNSKIVIKKEQQRVVETKTGVKRKIIISDLKNDLEIAENSYAPGTYSHEEPTMHRGRECGIVLEGRLRVWIEENYFDLGEGDAIRIDSFMPHRLENISNSVTRTLWVNMY